MNYSPKHRMAGQAEAAKQKIDVEYGSGEEVQKLVERLYAPPKPVVQRMIEAMKPK